MGQAKRRGSFDQRKAEGVARRIAEEQRRREAFAAQEAAMTPEQKASQRRVQAAIALFVAMTPPEVLAASKYFAK